MLVRGTGHVARAHPVVDFNQPRSRCRGSCRIKLTTDPLWIGGNEPYGEYFQGTIDEVRVYDRALTSGELADDMTNAVDYRDHSGVTDRVGLVAAFGFDAIGPAAVDSSGHDNVGTVLGATSTRVVDSGVRSTSTDTGWFASRQRRRSISMRQ